MKVGFVGCGEAIQALHIPALNSLASQYRVVACNDASEEVMNEIACRTGARPIGNPFALISDGETENIEFPGQFDRR